MYSFFIITLAKGGISMTVVRQVLVFKREPIEFDDEEMADK
jgi:hypothetical protein